MILSTRDRSHPMKDATSCGLNPPKMYRVAAVPRRSWRAFGTPASFAPRMKAWVSDSPSLRDFTRNTLRKQYASLDAFLRRWNQADRKQAIIDELADEGLPLEAVRDLAGKDLDPFDLICHVAFDQPPLTRQERADSVRKRDVFTRYGPQARAVLEALLGKYEDEGLLNLDDVQVLKIAPFDQMGTAVQLVKAFGGRSGFVQAAHDLQSAIYEQAS